MKHAIYLKICANIQCSSTYMKIINFQYISDVNKEVCNPDSIPPSTDVGCWSQGRQILLTLGRRWADGGLPTTIHVRFLYILPTLGRRWANGGFLFKMAASNNRGFGET